MDTTTPTTALDALAAIRQYAASKRAETKTVMLSPAYKQYIPEDQAHIQGFAEAMAFVATEVQRMIDALGMPQLVTAPAPILLFTSAAFARTDLATPAQAALGIEAYALHVPNIFDPAGPRDIQGWVCSPRMRHPQYVGYVIESDGATALERLEARIGAFAGDIEAELTPPPSPPAALAAPVPTPPAMAGGLHTRTFPTYRNTTGCWEIQLSNGEILTHPVSANLCIDDADRRLMELNAAALTTTPTAKNPKGATKKTIRTTRKPRGCQCPVCLRTSPSTSGVYGCSVGVEYHIYAAPDHYLGSRTDYREAISVLSSYRTGGRRAA